jgi:hypothetical protein
VIAAFALSFVLSAVPACGPPSAVTGSVCAPADEGALRERLAPMLANIDRPVPVEAWRRLPPEARSLLERIAEDPRVLPSERARALEGAAALGSDGAVHQRLAGDASAPYAVRRSALRGLGRLLPRARLSGALGPLIDGDADRRIRANAAEILVEASPAAGCPTVRAQAQREGAGGRPAFQRALAACGDR